MGEKMAMMQDVADRAGELTLENVPFIIDELTSYEVQSEDDFNRGDLEDYIKWVEIWQKQEELIKQIDSYRKTRRSTAPTVAKEKPKQTAEATQKTRYITRKTLWLRKI